MLRTLITHAIALLIGGGSGWWIGKKGAANVAGDVKIAVKDVEKKT